MDFIEKESSENEKLKEEVEISKELEEKKDTPIKLGMKWHNFLVFFALWVAALWNVFMGIINITAVKYLLNSYTGNVIMIPEEMYRDYPLLPYLDRYFAISLFWLAVYQIAILVLLALKKRCASVHLNIMIVLMCFLSACYDLFFAAIIRANRYMVSLGEKFIRASLNYSTPEMTMYTAFFIAVVLCIINWYYYKKRKALMCNKIFSKQKKENEK